MSALTIISLLFALTQLGDYYTTYIIIGQQGGRERTTWLAALMDKIGLVPALLIAKGAGLAGGAYLWWADQPAVLGALTAIYAWQCYQNWIRMKPG